MYVGEETRRGDEKLKKTGKKVGKERGVIEEKKIEGLRS